MGLGLGIAATVLGIGAIALGQPLAAVGGFGVAAAALMLLDALDRTWIQQITVSGGTGQAFGIVNSLGSFWMIVGALVPTVLIDTVGLGPALALLGVVVATFGGVALIGASGKPHRLVAGAMDRSVVTSA